MSTRICTDLSPSALANAVKFNLYEFFRYLGRAKQTEFLDEGGLMRWYTRVPHPWFNGVLGSRPATADDRQGIQETIAFFKARSVTSFTWWFAPTLTRADWEGDLLSHGLRHDDHTPGMAVDLTRLNTSVNTPPGFTIATVADTDALRAWAHIITTSYDLPASSEKQLRELMIGLGLDGPIRNYLGYLDGKPVATSQLFVAAGVGGIMFVATLPEARGQGIGAAITLAPLLEARHMGYRIGILQSSDMGFRIYRRLGFEVVCRMEHFSWMEGARSEA